MQWSQQALSMRQIVGFNEPALRGSEECRSNLSAGLTSGIEALIEKLVLFRLSVTRGSVLAMRKDASVITAKVSLKVRKATRNQCRRRLIK